MIKEGSVNQYEAFTTRIWRQNCKFHNGTKLSKFYKHWNLIVNLSSLLTNLRSLVINLSNLMKNYGSLVKNHSHLRKQNEEEIYCVFEANRVQLLTSKLSVLL